MNTIVMTEKNLGTAILPEASPDYFTAHSLVKKRIKEKKATTLCLVWKKDRHLTGAASKFIDLIKETSIQQLNGRGFR